MESNGRRTFLGVCLGGLAAAVAAAAAWPVYRYLAPRSTATTAARVEIPGEGRPGRRGQILRLWRGIGGSGAKTGRRPDRPFGRLYPHGVHRAVGKRQAGFSLPLPWRPLYRRRRRRLRPSAETAYQAPLYRGQRGHHRWLKARRHHDSAQTAHRLDRRAHRRPRDGGKGIDRLPSAPQHKHLVLHGEHPALHLRHAGGNRHPAS